MKSLKLMLPKNSEGLYKYKTMQSPYDKSAQIVGVCLEKNIKSSYLVVVGSVHERGVTVLSDTCFSFEDKNLVKSEKTVHFALTQWIEVDWVHINPRMVSQSYGKWSNWVNDGLVFNCGKYSPDASTVNQGTSFTQTASCKQKQKRKRIVYVIYSDGSKKIMNKESEQKTIDVIDNKVVIGNKPCVTRLYLDAMISNGDDVTQVNTGCIKNFSRMFLAKSFNQDIGNWDVSKGTDFSGMFRKALKFNSDIGKWDVSNGTDFSYMFYGTPFFNQDIGNWNVSSGLNF